MKKIIAFGASNSQSSINKKFAKWVAHQMKDVEVEVLDLNDYEMPIYGVDLEKKKGIPQEAQEFRAKIEEADGFIISFAEYNGNYTVAFKNIQDWLSRIDRVVWMNKPTLLLSTAPGKKGGQSVMKIAENSFPFMGARVVTTFLLPQFHQNFNEKEGILQTNLLGKFKNHLSKFQAEFKS